MGRALGRAKVLKLAGWGRVSSIVRYHRGGDRVGSPELNRKENSALAGVAQWTERQPVNQRVTSSIPGQGTILGRGPGPQ